MKHQYGLLTRNIYSTIISGFILFILSGCQKTETLAPYEFSKEITGIKFDWASFNRRAIGSDNWPITWADDGNQYASWGDGGGFDGSNSLGRASLGIAKIEGCYNELKGVNVSGGVSALSSKKLEGKSYGIISIDGRLYLWVSPGSNEKAYIESRLYYSDDHGQNWTAAEWAFNKQYLLVNPAFAQFGRDYDNSRDEYVYIYASKVKDDSALMVQKPGEILLMRVPKRSLLKQNSYQFFSGFDQNNNPVWTKKFTDNIPVFTDKNGVGWNLSVSFNTGLSRFFLITEHTKTMSSNIGIFVSKEPWGPWETVYYGKLNSKGKLQETNFFYNFSNKWLSQDGKRFTLVFSGVKRNDAWNSVQGVFEMNLSAKNKNQ